MEQSLLVPRVPQAQPPKSEGNLIAKLISQKAMACPSTIPTYTFILIASRTIYHLVSKVVPGKPERSISEWKESIAADDIGDEYHHVEC